MAEPLADGVVQLAHQQNDPSFAVQEDEGEEVMDAWKPAVASVPAPQDSVPPVSWIRDSSYESGASRPADLMAEELEASVDLEMAACPFFLTTSE